MTGPEALGRAFAAWAPGALDGFPTIAEGAPGPAQITGRDALALLRAAHAAGWTAGAAEGRAQERRSRTEH